MINSIILSKWFESHGNIIIAVIALIVSIAGVIYSRRTLLIQIEHNRRSLRPILHIGQWDYESKLCVTLKNCGPGVAIVKKMVARDRLSGFIKPNIYEWLPNRLPGEMNYKEYWTPYGDFAVQPNEVIALIELHLDPTKSEEVMLRERLRSIIGNLTIEIVFQDIYEVEHPLKIQDLYHFLRVDNENSNGAPI